MTLRTRAARVFVAGISRRWRGHRVAPAASSPVSLSGLRGLAVASSSRADDGAGWGGAGPVALGAVAGLFGLAASVATTGTASAARCDAGGGPNEVANDSIVSARRMLREARVEEQVVERGEKPGPGDVYWVMSRS